MSAMRGNLRYLSALVFTLFLLPSLAAAGGKKDKQPQEVDPKNKFKLVCPDGTEAFGEPPPKGKGIYCRQQLRGGSWTRTGGIVRWYDNGNKKFEGEYVRDKKQGNWVSYHRNGKKKQLEEWYNGERVKRIRYDKHGDPLPQTQDDVQDEQKAHKPAKARKVYKNPFSVL